jgi:hypothetical protein
MLPAASRICFETGSSWLRWVVRDHLWLAAAAHIMCFHAHGYEMIRKDIPLSQSRLEVVFTPDDIAAAVGKLAEEIRRDYHDKNPVLVGVLKGCFVFMADLVRAVDMPLEIEFMSLSSYGPGRRELG